MRIVVTGASGNVGTALLRRLTAPGSEHEVVGVVRRPPVSGAPYDAVAWVRLDLAAPSSQGALVEAMAGAEAVVHLAWGFQPARDTDYLNRVGVGGTRSVLRAAHAAGVAHLVHLSSLGVYSAPAAAGEDPTARVGESGVRRGTPSLAYSRQKVAAEDLLDDDEAAGTGALTITRLRPALVVQAQAGSSLLRYGLPGYVPSWAVRAVPVLPLDRELRIQVVHADDVADAIVRVLERRPGGAFNLAAEPVVDRAVIAAALHARPVQVPRSVLRAAVAAAWQARLSALDPGWIDLAFAVPMMDTTRAREELGWSPATSASDALAEAVAGMARADGTTSPVLRRRSTLDLARRALSSRTVARRRLP